MTQARAIPHETKKPNKARALSMITALRLKYDEPMLDELLLFFATRQRGVAKTAEQWVCRAVAVKGYRDYLNFMYVEGGTAYASDGHRAHAAKTELSDGYYCPATLEPVTFDRKFPDVERILARGMGPVISTDIHGLEFVAREGDRGKVLKRYRHEASGELADAEYLEEAVNHKRLKIIEIRGDRWQGDSEFGRFTVMSVKS